jgi:hypothetical protein
VKLLSRKQSSKLLANSLKADEPEKLKNEPSQPVQWQLHSSMINSNASSVADQNGFMGKIDNDPARVDPWR